MADFEQAFQIRDRDEFIAARVAKLKGVAADKAKKGDRYFLARQHAFFLHAYADCKCFNHTCGGCAVTLGVASALEREITGMDSGRVDQEEAKASAIWARVWMEFREFVRLVSSRVSRLKDLREYRANPETTRSATRRADAERDQ